jgi:peptidoglycan/LPS O-acetylase OafA/YrhL
MRVTLGYPIVVVGAVLILLGVVNSRTWLARLLSTRPAVYLGRISYGLYVFHTLGIALAERLTRPLLKGWLSGGAVSSGLVVVTALGLTVAFAAVSYRFLEQPFLKMKARFTVVPSRDGMPLPGRADVAR